MNSSAAEKVYVGVLLVLGLGMVFWGSAVPGSVGGLAILALGASGVAAALALIGIRLTGPNR